MSEYPKLVGLIFLLTLAFLQDINGKEKFKLAQTSNWEYAQFISQENLFQWVEHDLLITAESQQALLRKMGVPPSIGKQQFINDLIVMNYVGTRGWELVSVVHNGGNSLTYTFKRLIPRD